MSKTYIGIDPGKNGGLAFINENGILFYSIAMPKIGDSYDVNKLAIILKNASEIGCYCVVEDVHAIFGSSATSTFGFGYGAGLVEGILVANSIPYTKVQPKKWQKLMWEGVPIQTKSSSTGKTSVTDTKKMSLIAVQRIYPNQDLRENTKCRIPHDGIVDAILIVTYAKRMNL